MNGVVGYTRGTGTLQNGKIHLNKNPKILMGYGSRILKDSTTASPVFDFYLDHSQQPVLLSEVYEYHEGLISAAKNVTVNNNRITLQKIEFDSLDVGMQEFLPFTLGPGHFTNNHYRVLITPVERFYEFDRYLFEYKKKALRNVNRPGAPEAFIVLKKTD